MALISSILGERIPLNRQGYYSSRIEGSVDQRVEG